MQTTFVFSKLGEAWFKRPRYISSCGGTRSGKTYATIQFLYLLHIGEERANKPPKVTSVVSESVPHLKRGVIRDFQTILQREGLWEQDRWSETDKTYRFENGGMLEFFSVDNAGKVFGSSRDRLFINECQHIPYETARQLFVRTRDRILLDYNPTHSFWANEEIEVRDTCVGIHSTYKDNNYLSAEQVAEIESNKGDSNWWTVFGEGRIGTLDGVIYKFDTIDSLPDTSSPEFIGLTRIEGLDFGFANDPTARVLVLADSRKKILYIDERCYRTRMLNSDIISDMKEDGVSFAELVYADCAEPKSIEEIYRAGFNIKPCDKRVRINEQLSFMLGWQLFVTKRSLNLINELRNYTWAKDKEGRPLNEPIDKYNHLLDALRYAVFTHFGRIGRGAGAKSKIGYAW